MSKPSRRRRHATPLQVKPLFFLTSAILAGTGPARAQQAPLPTSTQGSALEEVVVTAQKRVENLQTVPISIQAFDTKKLAELEVASFDDYAKYLPSLSFQSYGPGQAQLYVRGVTNGGDGLHVGSQPLVGVYLDEMPVTTIANNVDVHIYDIARVEALSGPQGTLFGASSMAGTLRIITNKPDPKKFEGGYDVTANTFTAGDPGGKIEGFANVPLGEHAAIRLVGWAEHDGGYINSVPSPPETFNGVTTPTEVYPTSGAIRSNPRLVEKHYNWVDTTGGRGALRLDLADSWTVTPMLMTQRQTQNGQFAYTPYPVNWVDPAVPVNLQLPGLGDLNIARNFPERFDDNWWQAALTVEGKIANFDVIYAGGYMRRTIHQSADYSDYAFFYDVAYAAQPSYFGGTFTDNAGNVISPAQITLSRDDFTKQSHELRFSSPKDWRLRFVVGGFLQRQFNYTRDEYRVQNLADALSITGQPGLLYLNDQDRTDRDSAVFADASFDITKQLTLTGGLREFHFDNTVYGFFGYNGSHASGENGCFAPPTNPPNPERPCINIDFRAARSGSTYRMNLTYKVDDERMVYATWSTGFRPGGVNRVATRPPYASDYLTNFEAGWKTTWLERRLRFNGALFLEKWKDAQYGITGLNGITEIVNAGRAEIRGVESEVEWRATAGLTLSASATFLNAKLTTNACNFDSPSLTCTEPNAITGDANSILAPSGTRLPVSPKFKGNAIVRYEWTAGSFDAHAQGAAVFQTDVIPALTVQDAQIIGNQPGYASFDVTAGVKKDTWTAEFFVENLFDRRGESIRYTTCAPETCRLINVLPIRPRLVGISFGQRF